MTTMSIPEAIGHGVLWYVTVSALAWFVYPIVFRALPGLPDRGLSILRPTGLLLAILPAWWLSANGFIPFTNTVIIFTLSVIAVPVWIREIRSRILLDFLAANRRILAGVEVATFILFLGYVLFRGFNPEIAHTEKPMDLAFLSSAIRTTSMPPPDPWYAGEPINYYYLGYVMMAIPARLIGAAPALAFNLALATIFAFAAIAAGGMAANIARAMRNTSRLATVLSALLGGILLVGIGNLVTPRELIEDPGGTLEASWWQGVGWQASRVVVDEGIPGASGPRDTINEFPAFTFILGDLHPHLLAYPLFLSVIGLAFSHVRISRSTDQGSGRLGSVLLGGLVTGALYAVNAWDLPATVVLMGGALFIVTQSASRQSIRDAAVFVAATIAVAVPFALRFTSPVSSYASGIPEPLLNLPLIGWLAKTVGIVVWSRSSMSELLLVNGLFLAGTVLFLLVLWTVLPRDRRPRWATVVVAVLVTGLVAFGLGFPALFLIGLPLFALVWWLVGRRGGDPALQFVTWIYGLALVLVLLPELIFLQDAFGDRMNTVFKAYFQAWGLLSVAMAVALPRALIGRSAAIRTPWSYGVGAAIGLLLVGAAVYPPLSAYHWTGGFAHWGGLDGLGYLSRSAPAERAAIRWLAANAEPGAVLLEAPGCSYGEAYSRVPHSRISMGTGIPTVIGWGGHEYQWRRGQPELLEGITRRQDAVNQVYRDPTSPQAQQVLDRYGVNFIVVGQHERQGYGQSCRLGPPYSGESLEKLEELNWRSAFSEDGVVIYERPGNRFGTGSQN